MLKRLKLSELQLRKRLRQLRHLRHLSKPMIAEASEVEPVQAHQLIDLWHAYARCGDKSTLEEINDLTRRYERQTHPSRFLPGGVVYEGVRHFGAPKHGWPTGLYHAYRNGSNVKFVPVWTDGPPGASGQTMAASDGA